MATATVTPKQQGIALSSAQFHRLAGFITSHLGIKMAEVKMPMLQARLMRRLRALQLPNIEAYLEVLFNDSTGTETEAFVNAVTTNKTDFFREPKHFDLLADRVLAGWRPVAGERRFKLWCAGCSTGEEAYTQAMVLSEHGKQHAGFDFVILATDISTRVLAHAERAVYALDRIDSVPPALKQEYFLRSRRPDAQEVRVCPELRQRVHFHRLNFMDETYPVADTFDAIFIRNVMIYFDRATQEKVVNRLCRHLASGGYLFVGHSESLHGLDVPVRLCGPAVYCKR